MKLHRLTCWQVLEPIWTVKNETATRVKQRIGAVMDWAVQHGYCLYNPVGKGLLKALPSFRREESHFPALLFDQVGWAGRTGPGIKRQPADQVGFRVPGAHCGAVGGGPPCELGRNPLAEAHLADSCHQDEIPAGAPGASVRTGPWRF